MVSIYIFKYMFINCILLHQYCGSTFGTVIIFILQAYYNIHIHGISMLFQVL